MLLNSPSGDRVIPHSQQLFNVSIADTIGIDEPAPRTQDFRMTARYADYARATSDALHRAMGTP
mgnify:CR=1 FL=1